MSIKVSSLFPLPTKDVSKELDKYIKILQKNSSPEEQTQHGTEICHPRSFARPDRGTFQPVQRLHGRSTKPECLPALLSAVEPVPYGTSVSGTGYQSA